MKANTTYFARSQGRQLAHNEDDLKEAPFQEGMSAALAQFCHDLVHQAKGTIYRGKPRSIGQELDATRELSNFTAKTLAILLGILQFYAAERAQLRRPSLRIVGLHFF